MQIRIHPWIVSAGVAVTVAGIAILLRASFTPIWGNRLAFLFSFPAVVIAAWYGRRLAGLICTGMLAIAGSYYMHPLEGFGALGADDFLAAALFTVFGGIISSIVGRLQQQIAISEDLARVAREAEGERRAVLESIQNGFFVLNGDWKITYINTQAERMVGAAPGTLFGRDFWQLYPALIGTPLEACYRRVATTGGAEQIENFYAPLGKWFEGRVSAAAGGGVSVMFQDVTEQKRMVDALRQSRSTLEVIIEGTDEFIYTKDLDGRFTLVNRAVQRLLQKSRDDLVGRTLAEMLADPSHGAVIAESDRRVMQTGCAETVEETVATPAGTNVYLTTKSPRFDEQGKVIGMIGVAADITARKRIESELRSARDILATEVVERTSELIELSHHLIQVTETEKARLAAELHDALGGSLTTLGLSLARLKGRSEPLDAPRAAAFAQVDATLQEVVSMTRRIVGDLRPVTLDTLGLAATLQDHVDRWSRKTGVDVRLTVPSSMPGLDPQTALAVFRIVQESLTNIAKHAYASVVNIEVKERSGRIEAVIEDNGVGINRKAPRRVGTHGLLGMRERAAGCGGTLVVEAASAGRGTRIELSVPRDPRRSIAAPEIDNPVVPTRGRYGDGPRDHPRG